MNSSKRLQELGQPNPVKGAAWHKKQQRKLSQAAVGQPSRTRNSEGYFTAVFAHNADPYVDPAKIQRMLFSRGGGHRQSSSSSPSFKAAGASKKLPGQGFDEFKSLHNGIPYQDPIKIRQEQRRVQRERGLAGAPRDRRAFRTQGGYKKPTQFDPPVFLQEVDSHTDQSTVARVRQEKEEERLANLRKPLPPRNMLVPSLPKGGPGVSGQLIGRKNPNPHVPDPYHLKEQSERDHAARMAEKRRAVHGSTDWVASPVTNPNSSLAVPGTFARDTDAFGMDDGVRARLDKLAAARERPRTLTLSNWLTRYRLIKFKDDLSSEGVSRTADLVALSANDAGDKARAVGMRAAERTRFASLHNTVRAEASCKPAGDLRAWVPSNPGKAGGNSLVDPKATFQRYPESEPAKPLSQVIIERQKRMYEVLPEFEQMTWAPAGAAPRAKNTSSLALRDFSGGIQKAALAITKAGRFGPTLARGPATDSGKLYAARAAHDNRLNAQPFH